ncbi:hypothetical protein CIPAW_10G079200 [Carya illinoinensis]|uniref:Major facilitator superfamily (MFS) profile domain-containing protein n=1 Tax=Carya illinoinensis TaxID=32201 RepID=A0A8T1P922_CARIL|nr:hypothetical protein CIPAW_10G079200 [Carya illinoinensis]
MYVHACEGVISGALLYIREDFDSVSKKTWLHRMIVSMAVGAAIIGAAIGAWMNDSLGRRKSILTADTLFFVGAIVMAAAPAPWVIVIGWVFVGLGVGMASMTASLYISEASPESFYTTFFFVTLVGMNGLLIKFGQFLSYLINLGFTQVPPGTWRWMLGVAGIPPLYKKEEARAILQKIYPDEEVEKEMKLLSASIEADEAAEASIGNNLFSKLRSPMGNVVVRRALCAGIAVQVVQQFVGINTILYYCPSIMQLAGYASKVVALGLSLVTAGLNCVGTVISMCFVDRYGRRRMMIVCIIIGLVALSTFQPGACLANEKAIGNTCQGSKLVWYDKGCPSRLVFLAVVLLGLYIIVYSPGMGTVPWIVNAEIYPLKYGGLGGGMAAMANWTSNLIVSMTFLSLTEALGSWATFLLYAGCSFIGLIVIVLVVPETKGLPLEEIENELRRGFKPFGRKSENN